MCEILTNEEKQVYLQRYGCSGLQVSRLEEELAYWEEKMKGMMTPLFSSIVDEPDADRIQRCVQNIARLRRKLIKQMGEKTQLRQDIADWIDTVKDERLHLLLCYRYLDGLTWERIAENMHYSCKQIYRLHKKALGDLAFPSEKCK